ncbi:hypothetical protein BUALT_Bualt12G0106600 [Buddleja alternifolia]|uniref:Leucine-rich repeat-containing N-terminal plant-type domain-containing protein n=1 Tax=Buddleja alternifolia TaxID=168488 RepID=A0AAV6X0X5_9LAMI|nr:hypothetical protein BUALT_Bualt12G0106600 [Buddleja alternifolia]
MILYHHSTSADCCTWEGVSCDDSVRVTNLWLTSRGLTGHISPSIANLTTLSRLRLSHNLLSGPLPHTFFSSLNRLQVIDLSHNRLSGEISVSDKLPATIQTFNLSSNHFHGTIQSSFLQPALNLKTFDVSNNSFFEPIPSYVCSFSPSTWILDFSNNHFEGPISQGFGQCSKLKSLRAGMIPRDIGNLSNLEHLQLHINQLNNTIPSSLSNCTRLKTLNLRVNALEGELSSFDFAKFVQLRMLSGCKNLSILILSQNFYDKELPGDEELIGADGFRNLQLLGLGGCRFTGLVPMWLSNLARLEVLDLSSNRITGSIPGWIGALPNLLYIDLSSNHISGYFPMELTRLRRLASQKNSNQVYRSYLELPMFVQPPNLQYNRLSDLSPAIYLGNNNITGTIPVEIGQLKFIHSLGLSDNNFYGTIPETLSNLTNLEKLDLSGNLLSGEIPASLVNLHFLSSFSVAYNNLVGRVPTGGQFSTFPSASFKGNPGLCDPLLQHFCGRRSYYEPEGSPISSLKNVEEIINYPSFAIGYGVGFIATVLAVLKIFKWVCKPAPFFTFTAAATAQSAKASSLLLRPICH